MSKFDNISAWEQKKINTLLDAGKFEEAQALLKKSMWSEKTARAENIKNTLEKTPETNITWPRTTEQRELEKKLDGKIVLRPDGKIDFPELQITWVQRLTSSEKTNLKDGIVQWDHVDKDGNKGISWLTYMTGRKAMEEAKNQWLKLFSKTTAQSKTKQFLATLWTTWKEQAAALSILFWADLSGYRDPTGEGWLHVGSRSYLGLSEVDVYGFVYGAIWYRGGANRLWIYRYYPQPFLACESC